jgi:glycosyltransferase involved in cell wall biosynthesis
VPTLRRFKVLVVVKGLGLGGAERLIVDCLPYLDRERFDYEFAYLLPWKDFLVPTIEEAGFAVYCLGAPGQTVDSGWWTMDGRRVGAGRWSDAGVLLRGFVALQQLQKRRQFDLMQADLPVAGVLARMVGRRAGVPVVYTEHNLQERYHWLTRWLNRLTYGWNRHVLVVSEEVAASVERAGLQRKTAVTTLLNGVPVEAVRAEARDLAGLREELGIPGGDRVVGTVAVLRRQKRLGDWLEVACEIARRREDVTFLLVGQGPEEEALRSRVQAMGLAGRVLMPGFRPDGRRLMGLMDVYLMTSIHEGLPMALLEAMALGKPVVSTAVGGIPEIVEVGQEGFLVPVGAADELVQRTMELLDDPDLRLEMGHRGSRRIEEQFDTRQRVRSMERLYLDILGSQG